MTQRSREVDWAMDSPVEGTTRFVCCLPTQHQGGAGRHLEDALASGRG